MGYKLWNITVLLAWTNIFELDKRKTCLIWPKLCDTFAIKVWLNECAQVYRCEIHVLDCSSQILSVFIRLSKDYNLINIWLADFLNLFHYIAPDHFTAVYVNFDYPTPVPPFPSSDSDHPSNKHIFTIRNNLSDNIFVVILTANIPGPNYLSVINLSNFKSSLFYTANDSTLRIISPRNIYNLFKR